MNRFWVAGLILLVVVIVSIYLVRRWRKASWVQAQRDLREGEEDRKRVEFMAQHPEFIDDTAPSVLSVPPEIDTPKRNSGGSRRK